MLNNQFKTLTGFSPLSWQSRLFSEYFEKGAIPAAVDIPTGLGKTAVMALWLIARASGAPLPRRLVYVVDRRAVVDQATEFADLLRKKLDSPEAVDLKKALALGDRSLPISTLRGQYVDNREWLEDPASTAIIVGTVDMIGSRFLFEGYGVSRKMRPYHAGLLGADTLVVLDEAHLVPPFEKLLEAIEQGSDQFAARAGRDRKLIPPFKLLSLSATGRTGGIASRCSSISPIASPTNSASHRQGMAARSKWTRRPPNLTTMPPGNWAWAWGRSNPPSIVCGVGTGNWCAKKSRTP